MSDTKEPKKPSYVGPKKTYMTLRGSTSHMEYTFPTSMAYHKAIDTVFVDPGGEPISIRNGVERLDIVPNDIMAIVFPKEELILRKSSKTYILIDLWFANGVSYSVAITGENRLRIAYKALETLLGQVPGSKAPPIVINQEENKKAYIKHVAPLMALRSGEFTDDE